MMIVCYCKELRPPPSFASSSSKGLVSSFSTQLVFSIGVQKSGGGKNWKKITIRQYMEAIQRARVRIDTYRRGRLINSTLEESV